eukprot:3192049-Prymnesium_polylepis.1
MTKRPSEQSGRSWSARQIARFVNNNTKLMQAFSLGNAGRGERIRSHINEQTQRTQKSNLLAILPCTCTSQKKRRRDCLSEAPLTRCSDSGASSPRHESQIQYHCVHLRHHPLETSRRPDFAREHKVALVLKGQVRMPDPLGVGVVRAEALPREDGRPPPAAVKVGRCLVPKVVAQASGEPRHLPRAVWCRGKKKVLDAIVEDAGIERAMAAHRWGVRLSPAERLARQKDCGILDD